MKSYNEAELRTFVAKTVKQLRGAQLQEVLSNDGALALGLWKNGRIWLVLDLNPATPLALVLGEDFDFKKSAKPKPVTLFLKSHAKNLILQSFEVVTEAGRVLQFEFSNATKSCEVEVHLIPKQANLFVRADGKQISWEKPKVLSAVPERSEFSERSIDAVRDEWLARQSAKATGGTSLDPQEQWRKKRDRDLEKKRKALGEIEAQLSKNESDLWFSRGDEMKSGGEKIDSTKSLAWNLEEAYGRAKKASAKREGTLKRVEILHQEIAALESETYGSARAAKPSTPQGRSGDFMAAAKASGRTLNLADGVVAFLGRNAADNLALLRKAKAWDYWLHLKDYPGAHAIVRRQRTQTVSDAELRKVAGWLCKESSAARGASGKLDVVIAECRHVRPIKGDRIGRVTYQEGRVFQVEV